MPHPLLLECDDFVVILSDRDLYLPVNIKLGECGGGVIINIHIIIIIIGTDDFEILYTYRAFSLAWVGESSGDDVQKNLGNRQLFINRSIDRSIFYGA